MQRGQRTIRREVEYSGRGLFLGEQVSLRLRPQLGNTGIHFLRVDMPGSLPIPAHVEFLRGQTRRILLGRGEAEVEGIEHLMAALSGLGIDNLLIETTGREMPAGDGSAWVFTQLIKEAGIVDQEIPKHIFTLPRPTIIGDDEAHLVALPHSKGMELSYRLDFGSSSSLKQSYNFSLTEETFLQEIARARTFSLASAVEEFVRRGWGKGVTEENCFLIDKDGAPLTPLQKTPALLRFPDEPVRHKVLDLLGDLYLIGAGLRARVFATRSGHSLNILLAQKISRLMEAQPLPHRKVDIKV